MNQFFKMIAGFGILLLIIVAWRNSINETEDSAHWINRYPSTNNELELVLSSHGGSGAIGAATNVVSLCRKGDLIEDAVEQYKPSHFVTRCKWTSDRAATLFIRSLESKSQLPAEIGGIKIKWVMDE